MKWEYRTEMFAASGWLKGGKLDAEPFNDKLNSLGEDGWELVSVFETNMSQGVTRDVFAVLKRLVR
jgi:Domain of unknown function (DUF4177)